MKIDLKAEVKSQDQFSSKKERTNSDQPNFSEQLDLYLSEFKQYVLYKPEELNMWGSVTGRFRVALNNGSQYFVRRYDTELIKEAVEPLEKIRRLILDVLASGMTGVAKKELRRMDGLLNKMRIERELNALRQDCRKGHTMRPSKSGPSDFLEQLEKNLQEIEKDVLEEVPEILDMDGDIKNRLRIALYSSDDSGRCEFRDRYVMTIGSPGFEREFKRSLAKCRRLVKDVQDI